MAKFQWEGTTRAGEKRKGTMEAQSQGDVESRLRNDGLTNAKVKSAGGLNLEINLAFGSGVTPKDLQVFTRQLATMIDAGLPLVQCLDILANQTPNQHFAKILFQVKQ